MTPKKFVEELCSYRMANIFNPYIENCPIYDLENASAIRKKNIEDILESASRKEVDSIWLGRDLGHKGGRRTGLALTDEITAGVHGARWDVDVRKVTKGFPVKENTASAIWNVLQNIEDNIFLWNVFPFHPYEADKPFSNRAHNATERKIGEEILAELINILNPKKLVAIGNDAETAVSKIGCPIELIKFRHPSYGGKNIFLEQSSKTYRTKIIKKQINLI